MSKNKLNYLEDGGDTPEIDDCCDHCGLPCRGDRVDADGKHFCCSGCRIAWQILAESGLCDYYNIDSGLQVPTGQIANRREYAFLDDSAVVDTLLDFQNGELAYVTLHIPDIHCSSCLWLLERLPQIEPAVLDARLDFLKKQLRIRFQLENISLREVVELLASLGYAPQLSLEDLKKDTAVKADRGYLQIGVAGFCFGNMMLLSFPEYLSINELAAEFRHFFAYINLLLSMPVLFYSARSFFKSAWIALRQKTLNIDVPLVIGMLALFGRSLYEILSGSGAGYLDSFAGLVFLLLIGRLFQDKTFDALRFDRDYRSFLPVSATVVQDGQETQVSLNQLKAGDNLLIRHGEVIPLDARIVDGEALLDYSFITGESEPVAVAKYEKAFAGGRQTGGLLQLEALGSVSESNLTELWQNDTFVKDEEADLVSFTNWVSRYFTAGIILVACSTFLYWQSVDPALALNAFTAVLIIACPCALALSAPFTFGSVLRVLSRKGFFIRHVNIVEKLAALSDIVLDKTGTLTHSGNSVARFESTNGRPPLTEQEKSWVYSLARQSLHPASRALSQLFSSALNAPVQDFNESVGKGISGIVDGHSIKIGSIAFAGGNAHGDQQASAHVSIDGRLRGAMVLRASYRQGIDGLLKRLSGMFSLTILSGDNDRERAQLSQMAGSDAHFHFGATPQEKLDHIQRLQDHELVVAMVGDGLNDAGALKQADVGIAVTESTSLFYPACDAIVEGGRVIHLADFFRFTRQAMMIVRANLAISLFYNIIGLAFAVQGNLSPLICAILMPVSSISVILFSTGMVHFLERSLPELNLQETPAAKGIRHSKLTEQFEERPMTEALGG